MLGSRICVAENCVKMMRDIKTIGKRQYANFKRDIFQNVKDIQSPIKQNKIPICHFRTTKKISTTAKKLRGLKNEVSLHSRLYVANQLRIRDIVKCFSHGNQLYPPSITDQGILRYSKKSDIIKCIKPSVVQDEEIIFSCKIFDGGALVHLLKPAPFSTFHQYAENILI